MREIELFFVLLAIGLSLVCLLITAPNKFVFNIGSQDSYIIHVVGTYNNEEDRYLVVPFIVINTTRNGAIKRVNKYIKFLTQNFTGYDDISMKDPYATEPILVPKEMGFVSFHPLIVTKEELDSYLELQDDIGDIMKNSFNS